LNIELNQRKYSVSTPSSPILACSHSISMLRSPK